MISLFIRFSSSVIGNALGSLGIDDIEDVLVEVQDIDDEEFAELINYVRDEFDLSSITEDIEEIEMYSP